MNCDCGCGKPRAGKSAYASPACRTRAWKGRVAYGPQKPLEGRSNGNVRRTQRQSGPQLSYRKTQRELEQRLWQFPEVMAIVDEVLLDVMPTKQRERLEVRNG